jgi:hypothetical protein
MRTDPMHVADPKRGDGAFAGSYGEPAAPTRD